MNIKIYKNKKPLEITKDFNFPAGEIGLKLNSGDYHYKNTIGEQNIIARLHNSNDVFGLSMVKDALERIDNNNPINLRMMYCPYGQQDRVCDKGESFSLKVFAKYIKNLNFNKITIFDAHSDVLPAVFDSLDIKLEHYTQFGIVNKWQEFIERCMKKVVFVAPDAGANKKTSKLAGFFSHKEFVRADKLRDLTNGEIIETIVYKDDFNGVDIIIPDDICVAGRTFTELAKICKQKNCGKVILFVSHGIFAKGVDVLFNYGIDEIWTTNSYWNTNQYDPRVKVLDLEEKFELIG